jgi:hypothetical protein
VIEIGGAGDMWSATVHDARDSPRTKARKRWKHAIKQQILLNQMERVNRLVQSEFGLYKCISPPIFVPVCVCMSVCMHVCVCVCVRVRACVAFQRRGSTSSRCTPLSQNPASLWQLGR